jgi:hypothetical protein
MNYLFDALGGTAAVARLFRRSPSTVGKWRRGRLQIPAPAAKVLREQAMVIIGELQNEAWRLLSEEIPQGEHRAEQGRRRRREAFFKRFGYWPHGPRRWERRGEPASRITYA